jgi:hypothetical protein
MLLDNSPANAVSSEPGLSAMACEFRALARYSVPLLRSAVRRVSLPGGDQRQDQEESAADPV